MGRAPQGGNTALSNAALRGHDKVVQLLVKAGADKNFKAVVREGTGGDVGRTNDVFFCWGLQHGC